MPNSGENGATGHGLIGHAHWQGKFSPGRTTRSKLIRPGEPARPIAACQELAEPWKGDAAYSAMASLTGWTKCGVFCEAVSSAAFLSANFFSLYWNTPPA